MMDIATSTTMVGGMVSRDPMSGRYQVPVADRWAIAAYIKALQLSQNATLEAVPPQPSPPPAPSDDQTPEQGQQQDPPAQFRQPPAPQAWQYPDDNSQQNSSQDQQPPQAA